MRHGNGNSNGGEFRIHLVGHVRKTVKTDNPIPSCVYDLEMSKKKTSMFVNIELWFSILFFLDLFLRISRFTGYLW